MLGGCASWGCVRSFPALRPNLSGHRLGVGGPACHERPYAQVHTRSGPWRSPSGRSGFILKPSLAPSTLRPSGREISREGPRSPTFRELGLPVCSPPGSRVRPGEGTRRGHGARRAAGRGSRPAPASAPCGPAPAVSRVGGGGPLVRPPSCPDAPLTVHARPGSPARRRYHPLLARHFLSSPPRSPGQNRTPPSWSPTKRSPFLVLAVQLASPFGAWSVTLRRLPALLIPFPGATLVSHISSLLHCSSCELSFLWECRILLLLFSFHLFVSL